VKATLSCILLVLAVALAGPAPADDNAEVSTAWQKRDYRTVVRLIRPLVDDGFPAAVMMFAEMHENGWGVLKDFETARNLYLSLADRGHPAAMVSLGRMYSKSLELPADHVQAYKWFSLAALLFPSDSETQRAAGAEAARLRDNAGGWLKPAEIATAQRLAREWKPTK
jgi:TPR repeat protein